KSSPAFTSGLPAARSRPKSPICGFGAGAGGASGAGGGAGAGGCLGAGGGQAGAHSAVGGRKEYFLGARQPAGENATHDTSAAGNGYFAMACARIVPSSQSAMRAAAGPPR